MRQRWPSEWSRRRSTDRTCSLPQSHWMRRLSGKEMACRASIGCRSAVRCVGHARTSICAVCAAAASLGS
eukprot:5487926-Pleurochrysis_carterae.AAC.3